MPDEYSERVYPNISNTKQDLIASASRGILGTIPFAGSVVAELIDNLIPNQRVDRIAAYLKILAEDLKDMKANQLDEPDIIDLFEEGGQQSARATSSERVERIARLVSSGMTGGTRERIEAKRLLNLLRSIDDDQLIMLSSYLHKNQHDDEFHERHEHILMAPPVYIGSDREDLDRNTIHQLGKAQLVRLGVLNSRFKKPSKGAIPEFDEKTGMIKASGYDLSPLGRLLLHRIGLAEADEL